MKADTPQLLFHSRVEFRSWLSQNAQTSGGVWLVFGKTKAIITLSANDALEEALCFGWIDGQMQRVDENTYIKYFKQRSESSNWSEKNKSLTQKLESQGRMTDLGRVKIEIAKQKGIWDAPQGNPIDDEQIQKFEAMLKLHETAWANFEKMPRSSRTTYTLSYISAKTEDGRLKRFQTIIERLNLNLNPMESMKNYKQ